MSDYRISASAAIEAPAPTLYALIADYHSGHQKILPRPPFGALVVEQGGVGAGTVIRFETKFLGVTDTTRSRITEPEPGRVLQETDLAGRFYTTFTVDPTPSGGARVTITTVVRARGGPLGWLERQLMTRFLRTTFEKELTLLRTAALDAPAPLGAGSQA